MLSFFSKIKNKLQSLIYPRDKNATEGISQEKLIVQKDERMFDNNPEVQSILSDFENLNFKDKKCFDEIVGSYRKKGKMDLFNRVILNERKYITDILDQKLAREDQENFRKKFGKYLLEINKEMSYAKEFQNKLQFFEDRAEEVLSNFRKLNFGLKDNVCKDDKDAINYNRGWPADPFDKIANYYRWNGNIFLFNYVVLKKQKEIMNILERDCVPKDKLESFKDRLGRYLLRVEEGMSNGQEFLKTDGAIAFFDGCYVPCEYAKRSLNHYDNLSINITKPGQSLETSRLFTEKIKSMEKDRDEVKEVKIYSNDKRIVTIEKNEKQQRNYSFTEFAICDIEISWGAKDESGKDLNCTVVLNINFGQVSIQKSTINGENVEPKKILELARQNEAVLIKGKALHEVLAEHFIKQTPCEKEKNTQSHENIVVLGSGAPSSAIDEEITVEHPSGKAAIR